MNADSIFGIVIVGVCSLLCAGIFYGIGIWAEKRKDPMHFYSGTTVAPRTISDIPAYNRENAKMWKQFSIPFWLCTLCAILCFWDVRFSTVSIVFLVTGCTLGIGWLIKRYHRILKAYTIR